MLPYVVLCCVVLCLVCPVCCGCLLFDLRVCWWSVGTIGLVLDCAWVCVVGCVGASGISTVGGVVGWGGQVGGSSAIGGKQFGKCQSVRSNPEPGPMTLNGS